MKGFITNTTYRIIEDSPVVYIFGRLENGDSFQSKHPFKPYFFIKESDVETAKQILDSNINIEFEKSNNKSFYNEKVIKVITNNPQNIPDIRKLFENNNIPCFEADIRFTQRFMMDNNLFSCLDIEGDYEKGEFVNRIYNNPKISSIDYHSLNVSLKQFSFDIETDKNASIIYSISIILRDGKKDTIKKVLLFKENVDENEISKFNLDFDVELFKTEKEMLEKFIKDIQTIDPDVLVGWHVIDFDIAVIESRCKKHKIPFNIGRLGDSLRLRKESSFFKDSHANSTGRVILDGIQLLKSSFVKLQDYKLNTAAKHFLNDTKLIEEDSRFEIIDTMYHEDLSMFLSYNLKDSQLVLDILDKSGVLDLTIQRAFLTSLTMDKVKASIASFDSLYLRKLHEIGIVAPSSIYFDSTPGTGGFVMSSKPGIYDNIIVCDFKSLYPSLMLTFNIDPYDFKGIKDDFNESELKNNKELIIAPNGGIFRNRDGLLSTIITELWKEREKARKNGNELARYAIKILMNSMYGVLASPNSRFFNRNISNAITHFAQYFIKLTATKVIEKGYDVIYGDTDSIFVNTKTKNVDEAKQIGTQIEKDMNEFFKKYIEENYNRKSFLELEFEKLFVKFFMPSARGSDKGAKKRYAGLKLSEDGSKKLDFTGLEFVRRDWTEVSKNFQLGLIDLIFSEKDTTSFIKDFVSDIKSGKHDELLIYRKALRKNTEEYTKTTPPHVKAARLLDKITNNVIEYYITVDGPQPLQKLTSPIDYEHYIDKQIKPIAESLLSLQNKNFDDVIKGSSQKGLGDF